MPEDFKRESTNTALANVDLLLIIGTTLKVKPFGFMPHSVPADIPQVLINKSRDDVSGGKLYRMTPEEDGKLN